MPEKRTELSAIGEFGLIDRLFLNTTKKHDSVVKGIGDDAAVIQIGDQVEVISTDLMLENIHFDLSFNPLKHLGYKLAVINFSDIAAMNIIPTQLLTGIAVSNRFSVEAIEEIYKGIEAACTHYKVDLVGGDTTSSQSGLVLSGTAVGTGKLEDVAYRSGANNGDLLCVTGDLGGSYLGLQVLNREKQVYLANPEMQPELDEKNYVVQRHLKPEARVDVILSLKELGIQPTSMIDISDGLASEVMHIAKNSNVGMRVFEEYLPIDPMTMDTALEMNLDPTTCQLSGGEDYELLFTIKKEDKEKIKNHLDITEIGEVISPSEGSKLITKKGNEFDLKAQGWVHFES